MRLLLDTCTFLWLIEGGARLSREARSLFAAAEHEVYLSAVSAWEIAQKNELGKLPLPNSADLFIVTQRKLRGVEALPLDDAALQVAKLPRLHRDPFDRMLICQAIVHGLTILTPDPQISKYPVRTAW
ncbi:MAG: type II toxin-antitoxin system VapC family toxin [Gammaproteobacteria bacterium]